MKFILFLLCGLAYGQTQEGVSEANFGVIFGKKELTIKAKAQGEIYQLKFEEGSIVKSGDIIAVIDDRQEMIERDLASAEFKMASSDYNKTKRLGKYVSKDELQQKENTLLKRKSTFELKEVDIANTRVRSPIDGHIIKIYFDKGETVSVGDKFAEIVQIDELILMANIPSKDLKYYSLQKEVKFEVQEFPNKTFAAKVSYVSPVIDAASDTIRLKFSIRNEKSDKGYLLKPGMIGKLVTSI